MYPEYATRQINSRVLELLSRRFYRLIFAPLENLNMLQFCKALSQGPQKIF